MAITKSIIGNRSEQKSVENQIGPWKKINHGRAFIPEKGISVIFFFSVSDRALFR
jgi:hypothetical protein